MQSNDLSDMPSHRIVLGNSVANVALPMNLIGATFMAFTNCVFGCFTNYVIGSTLRYAANWSICQYSSNRLKLCCLVINQNSYQARVERVLIKLRMRRTFSNITCDIISAGTTPVMDLTNSTAMSSKLESQRSKDVSRALDAAEGKGRRSRAGKKR